MHDRAGHEAEAGDRIPPQGVERGHCERFVGVVFQRAGRHAAGRAPGRADKQHVATGINAADGGENLRGVNGVADTDGMPVVPPRRCFAPRARPVSLRSLAG
jgi:hypothetical protein